MSCVLQQGTKQSKHCTTFIDKVVPNLGPHSTEIYNFGGGDIPTTPTTLAIFLSLETLEPCQRRMRKTNWFLSFNIRKR